MPLSTANQVIRLPAPKTKGWYRLTLTPKGLQTPALIALAHNMDGPIAPLAYFALGPDYQLQRAFFHPGHGPDFHLHIFAADEAVDAISASLTPLGRRRLAAGLWQKLINLRSVPVMDLVQRVRGLYGPVSNQSGRAVMLPVDRPSGLQQWLKRFALPGTSETALLCTAARSLSLNKSLVILDARGADQKLTDKSLQGIAAQYFQPRNTVVLGQASQCDHSLGEELRDCEIVFWIEAGEKPFAHSCTCLAQALGSSAMAAFGDWLCVDGKGGRELMCSPRWDPLSAESGFAVRGAVAFRGAPLAHVLEEQFSQDYRDKGPPRRAALLNALTARYGEDAVAHLPHALSEVPPSPAAKRSPVQKRSRAGASPLVSLIMPTRARADLLRQCVESCFTNSSYRPMELIVVDHDSEGPEMAAALGEIGALANTTIVRETGAFNYSRLINAGASQARGEVLILLNDDIQALSSDWLDDLVALALRPQIGAVGARLHYPGGRIQHDGVVLGIGGLAGHPGRLQKANFINPDPRHAWPRTVSAVTGACLAVKRASFEQMRGLDEAFAIEFNDIDFCLRLGEQGFKSALNPYVRLIHHENATRGSRVSETLSARIKQDRAVFLMRWGHLLADDPWYSPNLSLDDDRYALADAPRVPEIIAPRSRPTKITRRDSAHERV